MRLGQIVKVAELVAVAAVIVFVVMLFANEGGTPYASSPGGQLFQANCASCHGAGGEGGTGPRLAGVVTKDFPDVEDQIALVTNGRRSMPSFQGDLTPAQIRQVVEYTRTGLGK